MDKTQRSITMRIIGMMILLVFFSIGFGTARSTENRPLMRFPDIHDNTVVFVYGEDIWKAPAAGGVAVRLTIHDGEERFPKFSPDGTMIAFTGEYDGNSDVYVMSVHGGDITRVTYHPAYDRVVGWHPTKNKIMFISRRTHFRFLRLYLISPDGTGMEEMILHNIAQGSFSPDGKKVAYNKVARENRTWKRYEGGTAQEVYLYDLESNKETNLTQFRGTDRIPMWIGDKIYFSSDRDRVLNIYSVDPVTGTIEQITQHSEFDVRRPSEGGHTIVYELGGSLWMLDVNTKETQQIPIQIKTDVPEVRPELIDVSEHIQGFDISPSGQRALVVARGEVFTVPKKDGPIRNLTLDSGSRDKDAVWSPDGKRIAYFSDKDGEYDLYLVDPRGKTEAVRLTQYEDGYRHTLRWSPNSKKIAFTDQTLALYVLDMATKKVIRVDKAEFENIDVSLDLKPIYDFAWSPDSRYIAYSMMNHDLVYQIAIYDLDTGKIHRVSNELFNDFHPVFSRDGKRLFFISNRRFNPTFCDFEWEMVYKKTSGIYCMTLQKDVGPFLSLNSDEESEGESDAKSTKKKKANLAIDFDGIVDRVEALPLPRGNYRYLAAGESALFYLNRDEGDFNRFEFRVPETMTLYAYDFESREEGVVIQEINGYKLSADGSHIVYRQGDALGIIASSARNSHGEPMDLANLKMWLHPKAEWAQIFNEAWRMERDFYYEPNMHGLDWNAMKEKYGQLIPYASCRRDIQFIVGELIGELNTSHTYVYGGDLRREAEGIDVGMLGADYEVDEAANRYRFKKILSVPGWTRAIFPPLAKPGLNVQEGDYLLSVNGEEVTADRNIYSYFQDLAEKQVILLINDKPAKQGAREIAVEPLDDENALRYLDWVEHNRRTVEKASDGQIGYIHLPDTYTSSAREFPKYFYGQTRKKGLIIDGRFNGGGLDPAIFLQRLQKKAWSYWTRRYSHDQTSPQHSVNAHMVCLTNRQAGSGGDELPWEFQYFGMGPVIGTRSWGGLVGVSMFLEMIDGGGLTAPDYRIYDPNGKWIVENVGVQPDIVIDLHPLEMARGHDAQLWKGVEVLMENIERDPQTWPKHEPFPVDRLKE